MNLTRRALLGGGAGLGAAAVTSALAGCGTPSAPAAPAGSDAAPPGARRIRYAGDHPDQFADLRLPDGNPVGAVVLLHGGYWLPEYGLDSMEPFAETLGRAGWATWNVEYRRTGAGGAWPGTLTDVAAAVDRLAEEDLAVPVVLLGHSAGGHLAAWAASRSARTPGGRPRVKPAGAVSLSGVLALTRAATAPGSAAPVQGLVGGAPADRPERYAVADPTLLAPATCPVWAVHAREDTVVPREQSAAYVDQARATGGRAELVLVPGDHLSVIDPEAPSFPTVRRVLDAARAGGAPGAG